jgi:hypothetical protein
VRATILTSLAICLLAGSVCAAAEGDLRPVLSLVEIPSDVSRDLTDPEGLDRWDLSVFSAKNDASGISPTSAALFGIDGILEDPAREDAVERWLSPDRFGGLLEPGARYSLQLETTAAGHREMLTLDVEVVGAGILRLPSTSRHVVLQRVLMRTRTAFSGDGTTERLMHRWVDPRQGVVALAAGNSVVGGSARQQTDEAAILDTTADASNLKIYVDELNFPAFSTITYGWDRGDGTPVSDLIANNEGVTDMGDLVALDAWDFSNNSSGAESAQSIVILNTSESCNVGECGYVAGKNLIRQDRNFDDPPNWTIDNQISEKVELPTEVTVYLRAGGQREGIEECFGNGESRFCYDPATGRTEVPLWHFAHEDADGFFVQTGDQWSSGDLLCEQNIYNTICGADPPWWCFTPSQMYVQACNDKLGKQYGEVLKGGVVKLPSGHTVNALLVRSVASFCVYGSTPCGIPTSEVRTVVHLWQVPQMGTVVKLQSPQDVPADLVSFSTVKQTDVTFGLYPPESIAARSATSDSVELWWDPGNDTHRIDQYRIHWDTDSGADSPYAFSADCNTGQVTCTGTTATVSGLDPATLYHFTVTSKSTFNNPSSGANTTYESVLFPKQVLGDPSFAYPNEVLAATTGGSCVLTEELANLMLGKTHAVGVQFCWDAASDPCSLAYDLWHATSPESIDNFSEITQTGETCWSGDVPDGFFLVVTRGIEGSGPSGR